MRTTVARITPRDAFTKLSQSVGVSNFRQSFKEVTRLAGAACPGVWMSVIIRFLATLGQTYTYVSFSPTTLPNSAEAITASNAAPNNTGAYPKRSISCPAPSRHRLRAERHQIVQGRAPPRSRSSHVVHQQRVQARVRSSTETPYTPCTPRPRRRPAAAIARPPRPQRRGGHHPHDAVDQSEAADHQRRQQDARRPAPTARAEKIVADPLRRKTQPLRNRRC